MTTSPDQKHWLELAKAAKKEIALNQKTPTDWKQVSENTQNIMYIVVGLFAGASVLSIINDNRR